MCSSDLTADRVDSPTVPITALPVRKKAFGGSATEGGGVLFRGGGGDLVVGVRAELARRGDVSVRAAGDRRKTLT